MKRKVVIAVTLAALMAVTTIMPVFAGNYDWDEDTPNQDYDFTGAGEDVNINVSEGHTATVGSINAGTNNLNIGGGGTLNASSSTDNGSAINAGSVSVDGTTVNATVQSEYGGHAISASGDVTISNGATVNAVGTGTNETASGYGISILGSGESNTVSVTDSTLVASGTSEGILVDAPNPSVKITNSNVTASGVTAIQCPSVELDGCSVTEGSYSGSRVVIQKDGGIVEEVVVVGGSCEEKESSSSSDEVTKENNKPAQTTAVPYSTLTASVDPVTMGEAAYTSKVTSMIAGAPYGGTIEINVTSGAYLNDLIISALETRSDVSLKINVVVDGVPYVLNIPAGFNLRALLGADGKIDLQKLIAAFGTAK